jgi:hypothetical protein
MSASVWQTPLATISTRSSPSPGLLTETSSILHPPLACVSWDTIALALSAMVSVAVLIEVRARCSSSCCQTLRRESGMLLEALALIARAEKREEEPEANKACFPTCTNLDRDMLTSEESKGGPIERYERSHFPLSLQSIRRHVSDCCPNPVCIALVSISPGFRFALSTVVIQGTLEEEKRGNFVVPRGEGSSCGLTAARTCNDHSHSYPYPPSRRLFVRTLRFVLLRNDITTHSGGGSSVRGL